MASSHTPIQLTWYGQSGYRLTTPSGKVVLIDPWLDCPTHPDPKSNWDNLGHIDLVFLTHGHSDHSANIVAIANQTGAPLVTVAELADALIEYLDYPSNLPIFRGKTETELSLLDGDLQVRFIEAVHGSSIQVPGREEKVETGEPVGFLITIKDGPKLLFTGDTALYDGMSDLAKEEIDCALICMGGYFTIDPKEAAEAIRRIKPKSAVPNHYGTYEVLTGTPTQFISELKALGISIPVLVPAVGETFTVE